MWPLANAYVPTGPGVRPSSMSAAWPWHERSATGAQNVSIAHARLGAGPATCRARFTTHVWQRKAGRWAGELFLFTGAVALVQLS